MKKLYLFLFCFFWLFKTYSQGISFEELEKLSICETFDCIDMQLKSKGFTQDLSLTNNESERNYQLKRPKLRMTISQIKDQFHFQLFFTQFYDYQRNYIDKLNQKVQAIADGNSDDYKYKNEAISYGFSVVKNTNNIPFVILFYALNYTALENGDDATNIRFIDENGKVRTLGEFKGKILLIDIWASWCKPCLASFPKSKEMFKGLSQAEKNKIQFVFINSEEDLEKWKKDYKTLGLDYGLNFQEISSVKANPSIALGVTGIPHFAIIDKEGKIMVKHSISPGAELLPILKDYISKN